MIAAYLMHDTYASDYEAGIVESSSLFLGLYPDEQTAHELSDDIPYEDAWGYDYWIWMHPV